MKEKIHMNKLMTLLSIIGALLITISFSSNLIHLISPEFIQNFIILSSLSMFGLGFIGFTLDKESEFKELQADFISASIWMMLSIFFGLTYISSPSPLFWNITYGHISLIWFIGGMLYFFIILVFARYKLFEQKDETKQRKRRY